MEKQLIGTVNMMPKLLRYFKCVATDYVGNSHPINLKVKNSAQNMLTLATLYPSITIQETHIDENEYDLLTFTDYI